MGILSAAFGPSEQKTSNILDLIRNSQGGQSFSGRQVTTTNAIQVSSVFACARVLGEGVAQVPLQLMREGPKGRSREKATEHPLYNVLAYRPNSFQTSFEYRELLMWHAVLTGDHFSFINKGTRGQILELLPIDPGRVKVKQASDYSITYDIRRDDGETKTFPAEAIWHVKGPSWNGFTGLEAVRLAREAIGLAMATEQASGQLHKNGVKPSGVYSVEGTLSDTQYKALSEWIYSTYSGSENAGKPLVLDRAAKWSGTQMSGIDAQSLETRRFQIEEICRYARVNPIMVFAESKNTTYASAEQMFLSHVVHTLAPWYQRLEQSIDANLLTEQDRKQGIYANFVEEGLLRGSAKDTKDALLGYVNGGLMTPNEGRAKLDMNPIDDGVSDELRVPVYLVGEQNQNEDSENGN